MKNAKTLYSLLSDILDCDYKRLIDAFDGVDDDVLRAQMGGVFDGAADAHPKGMPLKFTVLIAEEEGGMRLMADQPQPIQ